MFILDIARRIGKQVTQVGKTSRFGSGVVILVERFFSLTPLDIESGLCLLFSSVLAVDETRCLKLGAIHKVRTQKFANF